MTGMSAIECIEACLKMNLNCKIDSDSDIRGLCVSQSVASGSTAYAGDIIHVTLSTSAGTTTNLYDDNNTVNNGGYTADEDGRTDVLPPDRHDEDDG